MQRIMKLQKLDIGVFFPSYWVIYLCSIVWFPRKENACIAQLIVEAMVLLKKLEKFGDLVW